MSTSTSVNIPPRTTFPVYSQISSNSVTPAPPMQINSAGTYEIIAQTESELTSTLLYYSANKIQQKMSGFSVNSYKLPSNPLPICPKYPDYDKNIFKNIDLVKYNNFNNINIKSDGTGSSAVIYKIIVDVSDKNTVLGSNTTLDPSINKIKLNDFVEFITHTYKLNTNNTPISFNFSEINGKQINYLYFNIFKSGTTMPQPNILPKILKDRFLLVPPYSAIIPRLNLVPNRSYTLNIQTSNNITCYIRNSNSSENNPPMIIASINSYKSPSSTSPICPQYSNYNNNNNIFKGVVDLNNYNNIFIQSDGTGSSALISKIKIVPVLLQNGRLNESQKITGSRSDFNEYITYYNKTVNIVPPFDLYFTTYDKTTGYSCQCKDINKCTCHPPPLPPLPPPESIKYLIVTIIDDTTKNSITYTQGNIPSIKKNLNIENYTPPYTNRNILFVPNNRYF